MGLSVEMICCELRNRQLETRFAIPGPANRFWRFAASPGPSRRLGAVFLSDKSKRPRGFHEVQSVCVCVCQFRSSSPRAPKLLSSVVVTRVNLCLLHLRIVAVTSQPPSSPGAPTSPERCLQFQQRSASIELVSTRSTQKTVLPGCVQSVASRRAMVGSRSWRQGWRMNRAPTYDTTRWSTPKRGGKQGKKA